MDITHLAPAVQRYFQAGLAPSTQKSYQAGMNKFYKFCTQYNIVDPFPLSEQLLCSFATYLADQGLAPQTGKSYLSALRNMQISLGLPDPRDASSLPILKRVQAGISRTRLLKRTPPKVRLPITAHLMEKMQIALAKSQRPDRVMLWAVACSAFFGFFRLGELLPGSARAFDAAVNLAWGDVAVDSHENPTMVQVHLRRSKCDQFGAGADVILGSTGRGLCPVKAILRYIDSRGHQPGAFFVDASHRPVAKPWFVEQIRAILESVGAPQHQYAGHSFRIGAATTAAVAGVEDSTICTLGRWHSTAFLQYIRTPKERLAAVAVTLAGQSGQQTSSKELC